MLDKFYILGSKFEQPKSKQTIFVDGSPEVFREGKDIELSHWLPNRTPKKFKADTSTEICLNFASNPLSGNWDLVVNNHIDVDGILSVFTILHNETALQNREILVQAAEMGDFSSYGKTEAQILFQGLTLKMLEGKSKNLDVFKNYKKCLEEVFLLLDGKITSEIEEGISALKKSVSKIEKSEIERKVFNQRFVSYSIPQNLAKKNLNSALNVPKFNSLLSEETLLLPQARNKFDKEKVQLVCAENENGWFYDLHYPGFMWAETVNVWRAEGFEFSGSTNGYFYGFPKLEKVVSELRELETNFGIWVLAKELTPFSSIKGRGFPVILSFLNSESKPTQSSLKPELVEKMLSEVFN
ncbi:MAG: hypothetical protein DWQ06_10355 [Calditrichaeota bacterium]|nr:MAG: hypothetical protein DWQ06_10355 [Calditrichota bacterium]